jgi:hypothetical protein
MARKKKPSITPVAPQKTENQPTQAPSQTPQALSGGQSSTPLGVPSTPQKS